MPSPASSPPKPAAKAIDSVRERGLDVNAATNLVTYLAEQREATQVVPNDTQIVVERFRDELGDWRLVVHSPYGTPVHAPWALAINARLRERFDVDGQAVASDDGIVIRIPDTDAEPPTGEVIVFEPEEIEQLVTQEVGGSALFASRFRECAARALLLPRRDPGRRSPLWQQRQRSAQLLEVASQYPSFPIVLEAVRECLQDVYDLPALVTLLGRVQRREVNVVDVATTQPSPFARSLLFGYVAQFVYEGDSPIAERRAAALSLDQGLLAELLGRAELRELLDPEVLAEVEAELQWLAPDRRARSAEAVADLLRLVGPLSVEEVRARSVDGADVEGWLASLDRRRGRSSGWPARTAGPRSRTSAGCATGWACPSRSAPPTRSSSSPRTRSATSCPATPAATAPSPPPRWPPGWASARPSPARPCSASPTAAGCSTGSSAPRGRAPSGATPRCCASCVAVRSRGCGRRSSPSATTRSPASSPPGSASAARCAASTGWSPPSTSSPGARCRPAPSSRWCWPPASATTNRPCSTS